MKTVNLLMVTASLGTLLAAGPAMAQQAAPAPSAAASTDQGEIIVTAQKRDEKISKVGLTISAISGTQLAERSITSLSDVAGAVPGLSYINSANNTPVYNLRGVGFYDTSLGSYPTTSVYLDQVPLPFPVLTNLTAFDLERIEVVKGPQGTLYGQNSTGGAINYIAAKPTATLKAGAEASFGRFDDFVGSAFVSGPLSDQVRIRVAMQGEKAGPWQYSYTRPNGPDNKNGRMDNLAGRMLIDWDAAHNLSFEFNANGWIDKNQPEAVQYFAFNQQAITNVSAAVRNYPFAPANPRAADWSTDNGMYRDLKLGQFSLRGDWEFMHDVALTSITSIIQFSERGALDQDGINFSDIDLRGFTGNIHSFSQELRIANKNNSALKWVIGGNFSRDHVYYRENLVYGDASGGNNQANDNFPQCPGDGGCQIESSENYSNQHMRNYAAFGDVQYSLLNNLSVKGGLRYTHSYRIADICNLDGSATQGLGGPADRNFQPGGADRLFSALQDIFSGTNYPAIQPGQCFNLNNPSSPGSPNVNLNTNQGPWQAGLFTSAISEHNLSWRVGIDYKLQPDVLLYALVSKGYKAGGFGNINAALDNQFTPVRQESVLDYEGGFKAQLLDHMLSISAAGFYMDYRNKQLRTKVINSLFGIIDELINVPKSHIDGFETEAHVRPVHGLDLGASVTYLDAKIDSFTGTSAAGVVANFDNTLMPFTPKWQLGFNGRYEADVGQGLKGFVGMQVNHRSSTNAAIGGTDNPATNLAPAFAINAYTTVDAQLGIKSSRGWHAELWGKNLTNAYYWTNVVAGQDEIVRYAAKPVTYGVSVGVSF